MPSHRHPPHHEKQNRNPHHHGVGIDHALCLCVSLLRDVSHSTHSHQSYKKLGIMQSSFSTLSFAAFYESKGFPSGPSSPSKAAKQQQQQPALDRKAVFYMFLLALQFGVQPILTRRYTPQGITRSTVVLMQELVKFVMAGITLLVSGGMRTAMKGRYDAA